MGSFVGFVPASSPKPERVYYAKVSGRRIPEEIEQLEKDIAAKYVCNMSIFQSMPDFWAVGQFYEEFNPVEDEEVVRILREASAPGAGRGD